MAPLIGKQFHFIYFKVFLLLPRKVDGKKPFYRVGSVIGGTNTHGLEIIKEKMLLLLDHM